eukprot:11486150-Alexandrium_andersonii.AAC.1
MALMLVRAMWWCELGSTCHGVDGRASMSWAMFWSCSGVGVMRGVMCGMRRRGYGRGCRWG